MEAEITLHVDGRRRALTVDTRTTVLADGADLHPVQQAFLDHDGLQRGYCTPGERDAQRGVPGVAERGDR